MNLPNLGYQPEPTENTRKLSISNNGVGNGGEPKYPRGSNIFGICSFRLLQYLIFHIIKISCSELIFKLRIAHTTDSDFIEVEIDRSELTYAQLMVRIS